MISKKARDEVAKRSHGRCEAYIAKPTGGVWRCPHVATDIHHLLTVARGGDALDKVKETYHLIHLCRVCHMASDGGDAYAGGMLIQGRVMWDSFLSRPVYIGEDEYLREKYGAHEDDPRPKKRSFGFTKT